MRIINCKNRKGIIVPIVLCIILIVFAYIISLSWAMSSSRSRYENTLNSRKAYFMARSAMEHIELKIKTMQRYCYEAILNLEQASDEEREFIYSIFVKDILTPLDNNISKEPLEYHINEFKIVSKDDVESSSFTFEIKVTGKYGGYESSIKRLIRVSR